MNSCYSWDLTHLYNSLSDKKIELDLKNSEKAWGEFAQKWKETKFEEDIILLAQALEQYAENIEKYQFGRAVMQYISLLEAIELTNTDIQAKKNIYHKRVVDIYNQVQFFTLRLSKINTNLQNKYLNATNLSKYKTLLRRIFEQGKYSLTEQEEKILNIVSKPASSNWKTMFNNIYSQTQRVVLTDDGKQKLTPTEMAKYVSSFDPKVRKSIFQANKSIRAELRVLAEQQMNSLMEFKMKVDELRNVQTPELPALQRDDIDLDTVNAMVAAVSENFDISQKFFEQKANLVGVNKLKPYDAHVDLDRINHNFKVSKSKFEFDDSVAIVEKTLSALDPEFLEIFNQAVKQNRIDAFAKKGKRSGAFCSVDSKQTPSYILMNASLDNSDVTTLAHEVGHMIHFEMAKQVDEIYYGFSLATAEVASTFFEDFAFENIAMDKDNKFELTVRKTSKIFDSLATIHLQVAGFLFERQIHSEIKTSGFLSAARMDEIMGENLSNFYGESVDFSSLYDRWVTWPHLRNPFYLYSYASGLLISKSLQALVREDKKNIELVKKFFRAGDTDSPRNIFASIGIDITQKSFWQRALDMIRLELAVSS